MSDVLPFDFPQTPIPGQLWPDPPVMYQPVYIYDGIKWAPYAGDSVGPSDVLPIMDGGATPGASILYQRGDHIHPSDSTRAPTHAPVLTGMVADNIHVTDWYISGVVTINNALVVSQMPDVGGQPSVTVYALDRGYAMGMFFDSNNHLAFGNMDGAGVPQSNPVNIDTNGHMHVATTMLVARDPTGAMDVATKNYVDTRTVVGDYVPLSGGAMTGQLTTHYSSGSLNGGGPPSIEVQSDDGDSYISFHRQGAFACNFGFGGDWRPWYGGGSFGGGVVYKLWTTLDLAGAVLVDGRLAFAGDFMHAYTSGMQEPYGGAIATGQEGYAALSSNIVWRYRYFQVFTNGWWTVGYA